MAYATRDSIERILNEIPNVNRETVRRYLEEREANGIRLTTLTGDAGHLRAFALFIEDRAFDTVTRQDVMRFVNLRATAHRWRSGKTVTRGTSGSIADSTLNLRKAILKAFIKWVRGTDEYPPEVKWLRASRDKNASMPVEQVLTDDDLRHMIQAQPSTQGKAIVATLYDSGTRASEFVSLRLRDVSFDEYGAVLTLPKTATNLKTGSRRIRVLRCTPYLRAWFDNHPHKGEPNAPLWISTAVRNSGDRLNASALNYIVTQAAESAKITKDVWPHLFRHSRATACAKEGWPEAEMRHFFGWSKDSDMPSRYVHLSGKDYEENMLRRAGKLDANYVSPQPLATRVCQCGHENGATSDYCALATCGKPLTLKAVQQREEESFQRTMGTLLDDPASLDKISDAILSRASRIAERRASDVG